MQKLTLPEQRLQDARDLALRHYPDEPVERAAMYVRLLEEMVRASFYTARACT